MSHGGSTACRLSSGGASQRVRRDHLLVPHARGKRFWHWWHLSFPAVGPAIAARSAWPALHAHDGHPLSSGVPCLDALQSWRDRRQRVDRERAAERGRAITDVRTMGRPLAETISSRRWSVQMIFRREQTGARDVHCSTRSPDSTKKTSTSTGAVLTVSWNGHMVRHRRHGRSSCCRHYSDLRHRR